MRSLILALLLAGSAPALSSDSLSACRDPVRAKGKLIMAGDDVSRAVDGLGRPSRVVDITNYFGVKLAEDWHWERSGRNAKTIIARVKGGRIEAICNFLQ